MRGHIENPRILLLDTPLEYKKGESQTNVEITNEEDWNTLLKMEEEYVEHMYGNHHFQAGYRHY
jgi:T-complex protein 1 subunit gamma